MIMLRRVLVGLVVLYALLLAAIDRLAVARGIGSSATAATRSEESVAVVLYTDEPSARNMRVSAAVNHFRQGHASLLVMAGGSRPNRAGGYQGSLDMRHAAIAMGVPVDKVLADGGSNDTVSNLHAAIDLLRDRAPRSFRLTLVGDRLQLARLALIIWMIDLKAPLMQYPVVYLDAGGIADGFGRWRRLNHELLGYVSLILPRPVVSYVLATTRRD